MELRPCDEPGCGAHAISHLALVKDDDTMTHLYVCHVHYLAVMFTARTRGIPVTDARPAASN